MPFRRRYRSWVVYSVWISVVLLLLLMLSACAQPEQSTAVPEPTATMRPTETATASATPTRTFTATPQPTHTPTPSPTPSPTRVPLQVTMHIAPQVVLQGHTVRLDVRSNRPGQVSWQMGDTLVSLGSADGLRHVGYVGVSPIAEVGPLPLDLVIVAADGEKITLHTELLVAEGDYGFEHIAFSDDISKLLAPEITEPEIAALADIYGGPSADHPSYTGRFDWPWQGVITSEFGTRRQYGDAFRSFHAGLDIDGVDGDEILAPAGGTVVLAETLQVRGNAVILDHGLGVMSGYYHLSQIDVAVGDTIERGDVIGLLGSTGLVTGSHLHWEMRVANVPVEPREWIEQDLAGEERS